VGGRKAALYLKEQIKHERDLWLDCQMALPRSYLTSTKNLAQILDSIKAAQAPEKFTIKFLESLDFKSTSDRLIIAVLKALGFLSTDNARPTERYFRFLDQTQSAAVLAEGVREAYADLFQVNKNANTLTKSDALNKMKTLGEGQFSESVLDKMALTFVELCKLADFSHKPSTAEPEALVIPDEPGRPALPIEIPTRTSLGGLHFVIQIVLPETRDNKVYDAIFRGLSVCPRTS
jgi:hypothetical protein